MIEDPLPYLAEQLPQILTGLTLILIGGWAFEARDGFFLSKGSFRGKFVALILLLGTIVTISIFTPFIEHQWQRFLMMYGSIRIAGIILILGMFAVNKSAGWNYFDIKSAFIYLIGMVLFFQPSPVQAFL